MTLPPVAFWTGSDDLLMRPGDVGANRVAVSMACKYLRIQAAVGGEGDADLVAVYLDGGQPVVRLRFLPLPGNGRSRRRSIWGCVLTQWV